MARIVGWSCCVPSCKNRSSRNKSLSFHRFPADKVFKNIWIDNIKKGSNENLNVTKYTRICSDNFRKDQFRVSVHLTRKLLKANACPTLFPWTIVKASDVANNVTEAPQSDAFPNQSEKIKANQSEKRTDVNRIQEYSPNNSITEESITDSSNQITDASITSNFSLVGDSLCNFSYPNLPEEFHETGIDNNYAFYSNRPVDSTILLYSPNSSITENYIADSSSTSLNSVISSNSPAISIVGGPRTNVMNLTMNLSEKNQEVVTMNSNTTSITIDCVKPHTSSEDSLSQSNWVLQERVKQLEADLNEKSFKIKCLLRDNEILKAKSQKYKSKVLNLNIIKENPENCVFYTGFPNYGTFKSVFNYLEKKGVSMQYWNGQKTKLNHSRTINKRGVKRILPLEDEFLLVLLRLRQGMPVKELSRVFSISEGCVSIIITTWINFLFYELRDLFHFPSKSVIEKTRPLSFHEYPNTRIIIDCTEFRVERPSSISAQRATFSSYKNYNTFKSLIGISPAGMITFVSKLYGGGASDKFIVEDCSILKLMEAGDDVMADKGFDIESIMPPGVTLNIPPFFRPSKAPQMPLTDVLKTKSIAKVRVHVERAIRRIKSYHIFDKPIPLSMAENAEKLVAVCALLTNFSPALIKNGGELSVVDEEC